MADLDSDDEFMWGEAKRTLDKERKYYHSFFYENEEYRLFDNVLLHDEDGLDGHVGKIMKLWEEKSSRGKMMLIQWYLRPRELPSHLQGPALRANSKELFLSCGKGKGVVNENKLDSIDRKCKVLCTSKDTRNKQPSEDNLRDADYFFYRIYNVDRMCLSNVEAVVDKLGCDVVFNKLEWVSSECNKQLHKRDVSTSSIYNTRSGISKGTAGVKRSAENGQPESKRTARDSKEEVENQEKVHLGQQFMPQVSGLKIPIVADKGRQKMTKFSGAVPHDISKKARQSPTGTFQLSQDCVERGLTVPNSLGSLSESLKKAADIKEGVQGLNLATEKPLTSQGTVSKHIPSASMDSKKIPANSIVHPDKLSPRTELQCGEVAPPKKSWDANLQQGLIHGKVLLLQNVDPSFTSADIRELISSVFKGCSDAQMLPPGCGPAAPYGEALVIFETDSAADFAFQELENKCLVLTGSRRPLIASKAKPAESGKVARFLGHFPLDNFKLLKQGQNDITRNSVAVSHYSTPNTVEFEMAMEWQHYQEMAHRCWDLLYKVQNDEIGTMLCKYNKSS